MDPSDSGVSRLMGRFDARMLWIANEAFVCTNRLQRQPDHTIRFGWRRMDSRRATHDLHAMIGLLESRLRHG